MSKRLNRYLFLILATLAGGVAVGCSDSTDTDTDAGGENADPTKARAPAHRRPHDIDTVVADLSAFRMRPAVDYRSVPRRVLAFYYPWYGTPTGPGGSKRWREWKGFDPNDPNSTDSAIWMPAHAPSLGRYDSHDAKTIEQHCQWAKQAGIDGWIVSWWKPGGYEDRALKKILDACGRHQLTACIHYEGRCDETKLEVISARATAGDIIAGLKSHGRHPAYLKVGGRPVVFAYARMLNNTTMMGCSEVIATINRQYDGGAVLLGDRISRTAARVFDGIYTYNPAPDLSGLGLDRTRIWCGVSYPRWVQLADQLGRISTLTIIPGYDDTKIRKPGLKVKRYDGDLYRVQWKQAIQADPHWILITTFNEWAECSEIEPSAEYGNQYLELTAEYAERFKAARRAARQPPPSPLSDRQIAALRRRLAELGVAVLPSANSEAVWWLVGRLKLEPKMLSWSDVVDGDLVPDRYGVVVYASSEDYRQTLRSYRDVDKAILGYLKSGGFLAVLPAGPVPFYYNQDGEVTESGQQFGLTIHQRGWIDPPSGARLDFVQSGHSLPHLPRRFPLPISGDRRWRPIFRGGQSQYTSLIELQDTDKQSLGDAVAVVEPPCGGRVLYAWFGLLEGPRADTLLYDLFDLIAGSASSPASRRSAVLKLRGQYSMWDLEGFAYRHKGFYPPEGRGIDRYRWSKGTESMITVGLEAGQAYRVTISMAPFDVPDRKQAVTVVLNGHRLSELEFSRQGRYKFEVVLPAQYVKDVNELVFRYRYAESPLAVQGRKDTRKLAVQFRTIIFEPIAGGAEPGPQ